MTISDERLGFTEDEVIALMSYMGCSQSIDTAKRWYDGYRFGNGDVCNPWSMLYLAGCLTTEETSFSNDALLPRSLRILNLEVAYLYRAEIVERFATVAGGRPRLTRVHQALVDGNTGLVEEELSRIAENAASSFDLTSENSWQMLLLGLLFNIWGYAEPVSNREFGLGRPDIRLEPIDQANLLGKRPLMTIELKFERDANPKALDSSAHDALRQISERCNDEGPLPAQANERVRWGISCADYRIAAACERV